MKADTYPLQVLLWTFSGWVNRHQQDVIAYLVEENRVLKEQMKGRRLRLTNEQRRRLAAKGKRLGWKTLNRVATIVTPDTIMPMAPAIDSSQVDLRSQEGRPSWADEDYCCFDRANGSGEFGLGILPDPAGTPEARTSGRDQHDSQGVAQLVEGAVNLGGGYVRIFSTSLARCSRVSSELRVSSCSRPFPDRSRN